MSHPVRERPPATADDTRRMDAGTDPFGPGRMLRVLVVDANPGLAAKLARRLRSWGHAAVEAHDGPAALKAAAEFRPEVVICSIGLPGDLSGLDVARRLRQMPGGEPAVMACLTVYGGRALRDKVRTAGFDQFLTKPASDEKLQSLLAKAAEHELAGV